MFVSKNAISAREATAYMTVDGKSFELYYAKDLKATIRKNKEEILALGSRGKGYKTTSWEGSGTLTIYEVTSEFKRVFLEYIKRGKDLYFDLQIVNEDPSSDSGREVKMLTNCNFNDILIANFSASDSVLEQSMSFTFEDVQLLEKFKK